MITNNVVQRDWVRPEDTPTSYADRLQSRANALGSSLSSKSGAVMMRLYRKGNVMTVAVAPRDLDEHTQKLATDATLAMYDDVFPDAAEQARTFIADSCEFIKTGTSDNESRADNGR
jgi:hypothetical protein